MTEAMQSWCTHFAEKVEKTFPNRVAFIGVQGSWKRGEANEHSDIDMVVILDTLGLQDLCAYRKLIESLPEREKMCGFLSGVQELKNWPEAELFQFYYDTKAIWGELSHFIMQPTRRNAKQALQKGAADIYHAACHCFLFEQHKEDTLAALYKNVLFLMQAMVFCREGVYCENAQQLQQWLEDRELRLLHRCMAREEICRMQASELENCFGELIGWCSEMISLKDDEPHSKVPPAHCKAPRDEEGGH